MTMARGIGRAQRGDPADLLAVERDKAAGDAVAGREGWLRPRTGTLIPDFLLLGTRGNPAGPVAILMLMHLSIAVITYAALTELAPVRRRTHVTDPSPG